MLCLPTHTHIIIHSLQEISVAKKVQIACVYVYMLHVHVVLYVFIVTNGANSFLLFWLQHVSFSIP